MSPGATAESVKAFITSYYDEINRAIRTGDVTILATYSIPACPCRRLVESIKRKSTGSSTIRGGAFTLKKVAPHDVTPTLAAAFVTYDVGRAEVVRGDGTVTQTVEAESGAQDDISLIRSNAQWLVANVMLLN